MPQGTVVAGYTPSTDSGVVQHFPIAQAGTCQTLTEACLTFYWVDQAASRTITFSYTLSSGHGSSATVNFRVDGPTGAAITTTTDTTRIVQSNMVGRGAVLGMGPNGNPVGILFRASASLPMGNQGQISWIHLLRTYNQHYLDGTGGYACGLKQSPALDVVLPYNSYQTGGIPHDTSEDSPSVNLDLLPNGVVGGEVSAWFQATMYLMWEPTAAPACTGSACTIQVPLSKVDWSWTGDAVNTLQAQPDNGTTWKLTGCETSSRNPSGSITTAHPEWGIRFAGELECVRVQ